jgi:GDP-4-dehydro-6-deoxy-D-mannose reductase
MKALITGIAGQTGSHLAEYILEHHPDWQVHGVVRYRSDLSNLADILGKIKLHHCDLKDAHNVDRVISEVKPDYIFHLAATSFVKDSFLQPAEVMDNNTRGQINLCESLLKYRPDARIQVACSSEQFGLVLPEEVPIKEENQLRPLSPYGVSKCAQESLARQYYHSYKLHTIITRTFNHTGPRRTEAFVESTFCAQIAAYEAGHGQPVIKHGNLDSVRDYTDARDVARAYWMAVDKCDPGEPYNICSNNRITIGELLRMLISMSVRPEHFKTEVDPQRLRPSDVILLHGDCTKFMNKTGWKPEYTLQQTMGDLLQAWRKKYKVL